MRMSRPLSPQARFVLRATLAFAVLLVVWWIALRPPLLWCCRVATDVILAAIPGAPLRTGVTVAGDLWVVQAPVRTAGIWRNTRVETGSRLPTQLTVAVPLFWAILIAAGRFRREWTAWAAGTLVLMAIPPVGLLLYTAHVIQMYVFPGAPTIIRAAITAADYIASTVLPYVGPVLAAIRFHPDLRRHVLG
jgi:hypothetical protein